MELKFIPQSEFVRVNGLAIPENDKLALIAKMCRLNTLFAVKKAGSGHLGSSFSAMDIVVYLYWKHLTVKELGFKAPDRDIYFSSKGHDVPGLYSVMYALGYIPEEKFLKLRRLGGLDGHPDLNIGGIEANSGSLGMGISKAKGMAFAKSYSGHKGRVFVLTGDGEWQEGQNYEALQSAIPQKITNVTVIIDHNKLQSDRLVDKIVSLGDLEKKFSSFGWLVKRCDGHDFNALATALDGLKAEVTRPKILICDTIKGRGVSFLEHPAALAANNGFYQWHSGAPNDEKYTKAFDELQASIESDYSRYHLGTTVLKPVEHEKAASGVSNEYVVDAYGKALLDMAPTAKNLVVLDADLSGDCRVKDFEQRYPNRFVECGIAEQDMVSMAGGMALHGLLPVVNSFASFLASRPNEQIYNNLTERSKIIYACHLAGLIPAGPGKSHQSLRDISLLGANYNCTIMQACCAAEMEAITKFAVLESKESCMIRINAGPSPRKINLGENYALRFGQGVVLTPGNADVLMGYGPVMLNEALTAQEILKSKTRELKVIDMPWLNRFDLEWWEKELQGCKRLFILEDHDIFGGLGDSFVGFSLRHHLLDKIHVIKFAVEGIPACGTPPEVLRFHRLDGTSLATRISEENL
ncbi:MAG: 1-deoxy-D-xylulose-5-phosphate synthase N-terminal domain-containing protein [Fibrobacterota bacterium]